MIPPPAPAIYPEPLTLTHKVNDWLGYRVQTTGAMRGELGVYDKEVERNKKKLSNTYA